MLFADNVDKKLLPKNILILNARRKVETLVEFCLMHGINFKIFEHNGKGNGNGDGDCKKVTIAVFKSGKIIITGGQNKDQIETSYRFIKNFIEGKKQKFILKYEMV